MARVQSGLGWPRVQFMQEFALSMKQGVLGLGVLGGQLVKRPLKRPREVEVAGITSRKTTGLMALRPSRLKAACVVLQRLCPQPHERHRASAPASCAGIGSHRESTVCLSEA